MANPLGELGLDDCAELLLEHASVRDAVANDEIRAQWLTLADAADLLQVSVAFLLRKYARGRLQMRWHTSASGRRQARIQPREWEQ